MKPLLAVAILLTMLSARAQSGRFIEVTAEIEITHWRYQEETGLPLPQRRTYTARCMSGTNSWRIETDRLTGAKEIFRIVDGKIIRQLDYAREADADDEPLTGTRPPTYGNRYSRGRTASIYASPDIFLHGNVEARIPWLAFCSGPYLRQPGRPVPMPAAADGEAFGCADETTLFTDTLGLPRRIVFSKKPGEIKSEYQTTSSTNVAGWNFPTAFTVTQYQTDVFNQRRKQVSVTGRVTAIQPGNMPPLPVEIQERLEFLELSPSRRR